MRFTGPIVGLFKQPPRTQASIVACGVYVLCTDGYIREVEMNPKMADKILNLIKHVSPNGQIKVKPNLVKIEYIAPAPVSREEGMDYVPLARQLMWKRELCTCWRCGYVEFLYPTDNKDCPLCRGVATLQLRK